MGPLNYTCKISKILHRNSIDRVQKLELDTLFFMYMYNIYMYMYVHVHGTMDGTWYITGRSVRDLL